VPNTVSHEPVTCIIQSEEFSTSLRQSWEPPRQPTQRKKLILSSCGRRSSEEA